MKYGIMFFCSNPGKASENKYRLLLETAKYADANGFQCLWTPERHFDAFGGIFPNPAVTSAALATITEKIQIRAGSLISPLHSAIRIVENFSVVDNLSEGRVGIAFGSGWNVNDFIFFPERYAKRREVMHEQIERVRRLWRGELLTEKNSFGKDVELRLFPRPVQPELPIWITTSGNPETFKDAGAAGANLLTHLIGQNREELARKIGIYRTAREENGYDPKAGIVSLMLHTFMGADRDAVKRRVREPFREYLRSGVKLEIKAAAGGGTISGGHKIEAGEISAEDMEDLLDLTFERYFHTGALMGSPADCLPLVHDFQAIGVDEIACLIDFLDGVEDILESLGYLNELRQISADKDDQMEELEF